MRISRHATQSLLAAGAMVALASVARAGEGHREHGAHEHGRGTLQVVADGPRMLLQLYVPAANVVGFEGEPHNATQRKMVRDALRRFARADELFRPSPEAGCRVELTTTRMVGMSVEPVTVGAHGHAHDDEQREHADDGHAELQARYRFRCETPEKLVRLDVRVLPHLTGVEILDTQVITATLQSAGAIEAGSTTIDLAR